MKNETSEKKYTTEDILKIYNEFDKILNDIINHYENELWYVYCQNSFKNKIKRKIKKIFRLR